MSEKRGYELCGRGIIKYRGKEIAPIGQIFVHIYPEEIFLTIHKTPATMRLMQVVFDPKVPKLEVSVKVNEFVYLAKNAKVNKAQFSVKRDETAYITDVEIIPLQIEKVKVECEQ